MTLDLFLFFWTRLAWRAPWASSQYNARQKRPAAWVFFSGASCKRTRPAATGEHSTVFSIPARIQFQRAFAQKSDVRRIGENALLRRSVPGLTSGHQPPRDRRLGAACLRAVRAALRTVYKFVPQAGFLFLAGLFFSRLARLRPVPAQKRPPPSSTASLVRGRQNNGIPSLFYFPEAERRRSAVAERQPCSGRILPAPTAKNFLDAPRAGSVLNNTSRRRS